MIGSIEFAYAAPLGSAADLACLRAMARRWLTSGLDDGEEEGARSEAEGEEERRTPPPPPPPPPTPWGVVAAEAEACGLPAALGAEHARRAAEAWARDLLLLAPPKPAAAAAAVGPPLSALAALGADALAFLPMETKLALAVPPPASVVASVGPQQRRRRSSGPPEPRPAPTGPLLAHPAMELLREREVGRYNALLALVRASLEEALAAAAELEPPAEEAAAAPGSGSRPPSSASTGANLPSPVAGARRGTPSPAAGGLPPSSGGGGGGEGDDDDDDDDDALATPPPPPLLLALHRGELPAAWRAASFPTAAASPARWLAALRARVGFFAQWVLSGPPATFWLGACARPADFVALARTAAGLPAASPTGEPLPLLALVPPTASGAASPQTSPHAQRPPPTAGGAPVAAAARAARGVTVHGLALHGAAWDARGGGLCELPPLGAPAAPMPPLWLPLSAGAAGGGGGEAEQFACPLYGLPGRSDLVDTLVLSAGERPAQHWVLRGVALVAAGED